MRGVCLLVLWSGLCSGLLVESNPLPPPPQNNCADANDTVALEDLITSVRQQILSRLNLTTAPQGLQNRSEVLERHAAEVSTLHAAVQSSRAHASRHAQECGRVEFFADRVRVLLPSTFDASAPPANTFEWGQCCILRVMVMYHLLILSSHTHAGSLQNDSVLKRAIIEDEKEEDNGKVTVPPPETSKDSQLHHPIPPTLYQLSFQKTEAVSMVTSAGLRLFKRKVHSEERNLKREQDPSERVEVFRVSETTAADGKITLNSVLIASRDIATAEDGYVSFNITDTVRDWMRTSEQSLQLEVVIKPPTFLTSGLSALPVITFDVPSSQSKDAINAQLVVTAPHDESLPTTNPVKRQIGQLNSRHCELHPEEVNCCVREHTINFVEDLGWSWILYPPSYQSNYCHGKCPYLWPAASLSTVLVMRYKDLNPTADPSPCCVPQVLEPLMVLAHLNGRAQIIELTKMVVVSCICR